MTQTEKQGFQEQCAQAGKVRSNGQVSESTKLGPDRWLTRRNVAKDSDRDRERGRCQGAKV